MRTWILSGVIADNDEFGVDPASDRRPKERALGGDPQAFERGAPRGLTLDRALLELGERGLWEACRAQVGLRGVVDNVALVAGAQQLEEVDTTFRFGAREEGKQRVA